MIPTKKLYYKDSFLTKCSATVTKILDNKIFLDKTIAFPEGGGQISDIGFLLKGNQSIPFTDVQKSMGNLLHLDDFPDVKVESMIYHLVDDKDVGIFSVNDEVKVIIDVQHRIRTTVLHSALHLALKFAMEKRPELYRRIKGCRISTQNGRLDFSIPRFSQEEIDYINCRMLEEISLKKEVRVFPHKDTDEAWYWQFEDFICACGGMHVVNTQQIGSAVAKRKAIGKGAERLIVTVENELLTPSDYHEMSCNT